MCSGGWKCLNRNCSLVAPVLRTLGPNDPLPLDAINRHAFDSEGKCSFCNQQGGIVECQAIIRASAFKNPKQMSKLTDIPQDPKGYVHVMHLGEHSHPYRKMLSVTERMSLEAFVGSIANLSIAVA